MANSTLLADKKENKIKKLFVSFGEGCKEFFTNAGKGMKNFAKDPKTGLKNFWKVLKKH